MLHSIRLSVVLLAVMVTMAILLGREYLPTITTDPVADKRLRVTSDDIPNGSLLLRDFKRGQLEARFATDDQLEALGGSFKQSLDALGSTLSAASLKFDTLDTSLKTVSGKFDTLDASQKLLDGKFTTLDGKFTTLDASQKLLDGKFTTLDGKFTTLDASQKLLDGKFTTLDGKFTTLDASQKVLDGKFTTLDGKFTTLDAAQKLLDGKFTTLDGKFTTLDGKFTTLDSSLKTIDGVVAGLNSSLELVSQKYDTLEAAQKGLSTQVNGLEARVDELDARGTILTNLVSVSGDASEKLIGDATVSVSAAVSGPGVARLQFTNPGPGSASRFTYTDRADTTAAALDEGGVVVFTPSAPFHVEFQSVGGGSERGVTTVSISGIERGDAIEISAVLISG